MAGVRVLLVVVCLGWQLACVSHAGPFVTNISSDGRGGLVVEKCMARFDPWTSTVTNDACTSLNLPGSQPPGKEQETGSR